MQEHNSLTREARSITNKRSSTFLLKVWGGGSSNVTSGGAGSGGSSSGTERVAEEMAVRWTC